MRAVTLRLFGTFIGLTCIYGGVAIPAQAAPTTVMQESIVVLRDQTDLAHAEQIAQAAGGEVQHRYGAALSGFLFRGDATATTKIAQDVRVKYLQPNQDVSVPPMATVDRLQLATTDGVQKNPPWHLDRIDQRKLPLDKKFTPANSGKDVTVYVMDSGIRYSHHEFQGRAVEGFDVDPNGHGQDCWGHGTVAAGLVGGKTYGVAKQARLVSVKVIPCGSGAKTATLHSSTDSVLKGVEWLAKNAKAPAVVNASLGYAADQALDDAIRNLITQQHISVVVAAGNGDAEGKPQDACKFSPARVAEAIVVGASTKKDTPTSFSNMGRCVDVYAPGEDMKSPGYKSDTQTVSNQGTSEAAPIVAGIAALKLAAQPTLTPAELHKIVIDTASDGAIKKAPSQTTTRLVYSGATK